jgi:cytochrome c oxidase assembly protein subunit 11
LSGGDFSTIIENKDIVEQKKLRFINVSIIFKINDQLPLSFDVGGIKHRISVGSPQLTFCTVKNETSSDVIFTSIYNVYPSEALPHLEKIQCFCYDDQLVEAHSSLYLPVYYRLSPNFYKDPLMSNVSDVTISYSIFRA